MAETAVKQPVVKEREPLFGPKEKKLLTDPLNDNNPITVQVLGICSALAVTSLVYPSVIMAISVIFVTAMSSFFTSLLRKSIPKQVRMIVQLVIIATLVTIVEQALKALNFEIYKQLICLYWPDHYQLYCNGTTGSICDGQQTVEVTSGWYW